MIYKIEYIKGVRKFVKDELYKYFPEQFTILKENLVEIFIETNVQDIDAFRVLKTALHVSLIENDRVVVERNLFRREWRKFLVPAGLNPTLANVMCELAKVKEGEIIMDPFCGGGTITITALLDYKAKKALASDISSKAIEYTKKNLLEAKITKDKYSIFISDVKRLRIQKDYLDKVITNMPFGIRTGKHDTNKAIYSSFVKFAHTSLKKDGLLVCLTTEKKLLIENTGKLFELIDEVEVSQGGLHPSIFVLKKI